MTFLVFPVFSARFFLSPGAPLLVGFYSRLQRLPLHNGGLLSAGWWLRSGGLSAAGAGDLSAARAETFPVRRREREVLLGVKVQLGPLICICSYCTPNWTQINDFVQCTPV